MHIRVHFGHRWTTLFEGICMGRRMDEYLDASIASCYHIANDIVEGFLLT